MFNDMLMTMWVSFFYLINYLLLKRPPYYLPIYTSWPFIDIQLLLQQNCCDNSLLSSIWPLSGPLVTSIWALVSTNTLTMTKRMRRTSKTVHTVHTEQTYVHSACTVWSYVCTVTMSWNYYVSWLHSYQEICYYEIYSYLPKL